jgi:hypothetical protein
VSVSRFGQIGQWWPNQRRKWRARFGGTSWVKLGYCRWQDSAHDPSSAATIDASQNSSSREARREPTVFQIQPRTLIRRTRARLSHLAA